MNKGYKNRAMTTETAPSKQTFFFPKNNPPVSIEADSQEEAEKKLKALNNKNK